MSNTLPPADVLAAAAPLSPPDSSLPCDRELRLDALLCGALARYSERVALRFEGESLSYAELDQRSAELADALRAAGAGRDVRIAIAAERSFELVIALVAVLRAGAAYVPIDPSYPAARQAFMLEDARAQILLGQQRCLDALPATHATRIALDGLRSGPARACAPLAPLGEDPADLSYVIYTSGSTGQPKGAMNHHRGTVNQLLWLQQRFPLGADDAVLQKTSLSFDPSVWEFFWPLLAGARVVIARPEGHKDPAYLARLIQSERVTLCQFVPSMLHSFLGEPELAQRCRSLRRVICGGEPLTRALQDHFFALLDCELHNLYGPTETAVLVTHWACRRDWSEPFVPIGQPIANTRIYLLDPDGNPVADAEPGELYIGGVQVGRGYLGREELTRERFLPDPFAPASERTGGAEPRMYRSGDLARWRSDANLEFLGRADHQVKILGVRIELGEIESALEAHPQVAQAVAVAHRGASETPRLIAYVTPVAGERCEPTELRSWLAQRLPPALVPSCVCALDAFPLGATGKVDRAALPLPTRERPPLSTEYEAPASPLEAFLCALWAQLLRLARVGARDSCFELGGDSLLGADFTRRVSGELGVQLAIVSLFEAPSPRAFAAFLEREHAAAVKARFELAAGIAAPRPAPAEPRAARAPLASAPEADYPLTDGQLELWLAARLSTDACRAFQIPICVQLEGAIDVPALERAIGALLQRHSALRTHFAPDGKSQRVAASVHAPLRVLDLSAMAPAQRQSALAQFHAANAQEPFDLATGPLIRFALLRLAERQYELAITVHHIVCDGWSTTVVVRDLGALYGAELAGTPAALPPALQFERFAREQRERIEAHPECEAYWLEQLKAPLPRLELPLDRPRPAQKTYAGAQTYRSVGSGTLTALRREAARRKTTPFALAFTAYALLLKRLADTDDVIIGVATAGQLAAGYDDLIGHCANLLPVRCSVPREAPLGQHLETVRRSLFEAQDQRDCTFGRLIQKLRLPRDPGRLPLLSTTITHQSDPIGLSFGGAEPRFAYTDKPYCNFDLELYLTESAGELLLDMHYNRDLFDAQTIARWLGHLETLLVAIGRGGELPGSELPLLRSDEERALLELCTGPRLEHDRQTTLGALFQSQAQRSPEATALLWRGVRLSYAELDARANRLARRLIELGVQAGTLVGLCVERTDAMITALLAIHKAGGAYVPLDPAYPQQRIAFMLEDCGAPVLITQESVRERLAQASQGLQVLCLQSEAARIAALDASPLPPRAGASDLAYVIYTSGSTGKPKGVAIEHRSVLALLAWARELFSAQDLRGVLATTSICFDISVFELFATLTGGGALILEENALALPTSPHASEVTLINTVPSAIGELVRMRALPPGVRVVTLCGERLTAERVDRIYEQLPRARVYDLYGPTEDTVFSTWTLREPGGLETIGRPLHNSGAYVLDAHRKLLPIGVPGELYLGGEGLARGYLLRPELSAERFVQSPFDASRTERLYRTGDRVRVLRDGRLIYLGRLDHQVKLRGFRIELGEVEAALRGCAGVREAVAIVREMRPGDARLTAYVVPAPGAELAPERLRAALRASLPDYMVPSYVVPLAALPLTPNGKTDRAALPAPDFAAAAPAAAPAAPNAALERELAALWCELLGVRAVDPQADFFEIGGHSLLAIQLLTEVNERFGSRLATTDFFAAPSFAALLALLAPQHAASAQAAAPAPAPAAPAQLPTQADADEAGLGELVSQPLAADLERVRLAVKQGRSAERGPSRWMRESWLARHVLAPLFAIRRGSLRRALQWLILKLEGGELYTVTLRKLYAKYYDIHIGDFSVGGFNLETVKRGTEIGRYSVITDTSRMEVANHPINTLSYHGLFYRAILGFADEVPIPRKRLRVGNDVFIGHNASVLYPTEEIGDGAIIAAHAVVAFNVPPYAVVAGYPARIVRYRFSPEKIRELLELKWWEADLQALEPVREQFARPVEGKKLR